MLYGFLQSRRKQIIACSNSTTNDDALQVEGIDQAGKATLLGRGAHATGYYSISFDSPTALATFIDTKKDDLSTNQYEWAKWAIARAH